MEKYIVCLKYEVYESYIVEATSIENASYLAKEDLIQHCIDNGISIGEIKVISIDEE